jgi:hypothetical protein
LLLIFGRLKSIFALSPWERVGERAYGFLSVISHAPLPQPFSQREQEQVTNEKCQMTNGK